MKNFEDVLAKSVNLGFHENEETLSTAVKDILSQIPDSFTCYPNSIDEGCKWLRILDKNEDICCLVHRYYKVAFVSDKLNVKCDILHCENVGDFLSDEWYINDVKELNQKFSHLNWDESCDVVNPKKFDLLNMEFATE
ncbi:MAG: hypothetical protein IKJ60_04505 [Ruminococcus sp.]|nr:hypothetical protein [Ruminococcus sp.]